MPSNSTNRPPSYLTQLLRISHCLKKRLANSRATSTTISLSATARTNKTNRMSNTAPRWLIVLFTWKTSTCWSKRTWGVVLHTSSWRNTNLLVMICTEWESYNQRTSRLSKLCRDVLSILSRMRVLSTSPNKTTHPCLKLIMTPRQLKRKNKLISNLSPQLPNSPQLKNKNRPLNQWLKKK